MRISITINPESEVPRFSAARSALITQGSPQQHESYCCVSSNFVAHLAAMFLQASQTQAGQRAELHDATQIYDAAAAARPASPGATIHMRL
jgi:hypothetical protein